MVARENALVREMKKAYKGGGYTVAVYEGGKTMICADCWAVEFAGDSVPREALSLLALHMGFLPAEGEAYKIYAGDKEPTVQDTVFETAVSFIAEFEARKMDSVPETVRKTVLTYDGRAVWQKSGGDIMLVDPALEKILYKRTNVRAVGNALFDSDAESTVCVLCGSGPADDLSRLASVKWPTVE